MELKYAGNNTLGKMRIFLTQWEKLELNLCCKNINKGWNPMWLTRL